MLKRYFFAFILTSVMPFLNNTIQAENSLKPFVSNSLTNIKQTYLGKPFLLSFWSIDCPPCIKELLLLQNQLHEQADINIVLVSTDPISHAQQARNVLGQFSLTAVDNWIFAEEFVERLRYQVDPYWTGSIPQAYFYTQDHQRKGVTGALESKHFEEWRHLIKDSANK